jgi:hypothetical protein
VSVGAATPRSRFGNDFAGTAGSRVCRRVRVAETRQVITRWRWKYDRKVNQAIKNEAVNSFAFPIVRDVEKRLRVKGAQGAGRTGGVCICTCSTGSGDTIFLAFDGVVDSPQREPAVCTNKTSRVINSD